MPFKSIRTRLLLLVAISVLPAFALIVYSGIKGSRRDADEARADCLKVTRNLADEHARAVESTRQLLMTLAKLPDVQDENRLACSRLFAALLRESPLYANIWAADSEGIVFASGLSYAPCPVRQKKLFQEVARTKRFSAGEYLVGPASHRPTLTFAYPVVGRKGVFRGFVVAGLDLQRYGERFTKTSLPGDSVLAMLDRNYVCLYRSRHSQTVGKVEAPDNAEPMRADAPEGTFTGKNTSGIKCLYAYKRLYLSGDPEPYLFIRVSTPEQKALFSARRNLFRSLSLLFSAMVLVMASAWLLGGKLLVKGLNALLDASRRLGQGDLAARTGLTHKNDELGQVTKAFDAMAVQLEQREAQAARAEQALRESEERYRNIFENALQGVFQSTPDSRFLSVNLAFAKMAGYESPDEMKLAISSIRNQLYVKSEDHDEFKAVIEKNGFIERYEAQFYRKDGGKIWCSTSGRAACNQDGKVLFYEGISEEITERKRAQEALLESEEKFRRLFEESADPIVLLDRSGFTDCNEAALKLLHCPDKERFIGLRPRDISPERQPDGRLSAEEGSESTQAVLEKGAVRFEWVHRSFDGEEFWVAVTNTLIPIQGREVFFSVWRDITEHKRVEKALSESEERYRTAIESSNDGIAIFKDRKHLYANRKYLEMFGFNSPEEVLGKRWSCAIHKNDRRRFAEINRRKGQNGDTLDSYPLKGVRTDGETVFVEVSTTTTTYRGEQVTLAYLRDVTGRKNLEAQLLQAQKMEAVGALAAGVAHDFNNILMALMGYGNLLQMKMSPNDPLRVYVDHMLASTGKAANLTQSLLTFGRKTVMALESHKLSDLVKDTEKLLRRLLPEDMGLELVFGDDVAVMADMTQIGQVLMNLATNARDAMPNGGVLRIETTRTQIDRNFKRLHGYGEPGEYALISVTDTGAGMDENTKQKIFEPFFTTKEVGKGTGLGLSIVYGIIKQHGGYINVYSEPGMGSAFHLYLPAVRTRAADSKPVEARTVGGVETILFAEDNSDIRSMASDLLRFSGYTVVEASNGADAVEQFKKHRETIDLLILDVVMPVMNGKEAYQEIKAIREDMKAIFMSGYASEVVFEKGIRPDGWHYVPKPLAPNDLLRKVREALDSR